MSDFTVVEIQGDVVTVDVSEVSPGEVSVYEGSPITLELPSQLVIDASTSTVTKMAGESLGGHRAVYAASDGKVCYADSSVPLGLHRTLGITTGAVISGEPATVQTYGRLFESSWNWTVGTPVYLGTNGVLTQTCPTTGFIQELGFPIDSKTLFISISLPIVLGG